MFHLNPQARGFSAKMNCTSDDKVESGHSTESQSTFQMRLVLVYVYTAIILLKNKKSHFQYQLKVHFKNIVS